ncbi:hypothetical protein Dimus_012108 [Dionaea muscipula]
MFTVVWCSKTHHLRVLAQKVIKKNSSKEFYLVVSIIQLYQTQNTRKVVSRSSTQNPSLPDTDTTERLGNNVSNLFALSPKNWTKIEQCYPGLVSPNPNSQQIIIAKVISSGQ